MILSAICDSAGPDHINQGLWASWRTGGGRGWLRPRMTELGCLITGACCFPLTRAKLRYSRRSELQLR